MIDFERDEAEALQETPSMEGLVTALAVLFCALGVVTLYVFAR